MLESDEAARRLGVKVTTLYAYVSRGLLGLPSGTRRAAAASSTVDEVERLARRSREGKTVETRMATITTGITQLTDGARSTGAVGQSTWPPTASFEEVAERLWDVREPEGADARRWDRARTSGRPPVCWPPATERDRWAVVMAGALDPAPGRPAARGGRPDRAPLIASMVDALVAAARAAPWQGRPPTARTGRSPLDLDDGRDRREFDRRRGSRRCLEPGPERGAGPGGATPHWSCWPTTSWPPRRWRCGWPPRPGPTPTTRCSPGSGPSPGRLHGGASQLAYTPARRGRPRSGSSGPSTTPSGGRDVLPGFRAPGLQARGRPLRRARRPLRRAGRRRRSSAGPLARRARRGPRHPPAQRRPRPGRGRLVDRNAAGRRTDPLHRGAGRRVGRPLSRGARRATAPVPGPRRLRTPARSERADPTGCRDGALRRTYAPCHEPLARPQSGSDLPGDRRLVRHRRRRSPALLAARGLGVTLVARSRVEAARPWPTS